MIKNFVLFFCVLFGVQIYAQQGTASPYSYYGLGSLKFRGTVENKSMGGIGIYTDSIHINMQNPASYGGENLLSYGNLARPVKFTVAGSHTNTTLKAASAEEKNSVTTFDYVALSFPINKLGVGFGLVPYTSVGYKLENKNESNDVLHRFSGEGGVNRVFLSAGYQLTKSFSFGVDAQYNFGNIENKIIDYLYSDGHLLQYQTRQNNESYLSGFSFNFGAMYKTKLTQKLNLHLSATYAPEAKIDSENTQTLSTITINSSTGEEYEVNTIDSDLNNLKNTKQIIPQKYSAGIGLGQDLKWFAGIEYTFYKASSLSNELYDQAVTAKINDGSILSIGGFFTPEYDSYDNYFKRITYRAGLRFEDTGLEIQNEPVKEFGTSFGLGLPVKNAFSNLNVGFEIGKRGTTNNNLIQENYFSINIGLSLNDRWFQKRKYN